MKIINATAWKTEDLQTLVDRAEREAKALGAKSHREAKEVFFKSTSHHEQVRVYEAEYDSGRVQISMWQPVKFKNKLDELTKIAAHVGGFRMPETVVGRLLVGLKITAFGANYDRAGNSYYYDSREHEEIAKEEKELPIIGERLAEEGRRDEATIDLEQAIINREEARKRWGREDQSYANSIEKLKKAIDFNNKKLEKRAQERAASK
jgi:hypothetical protein